MLTFTLLIITSFLADLMSWSVSASLFSLQLLAISSMLLFVAPAWLMIPCAIGLCIEGILVSPTASASLLYLMPATLIIHTIRSSLALPLWLSISSSYCLFFIGHFLVHSLPFGSIGYTFLALSANLIVLNLVLKYIIKVA